MKKYILPFLLALALFAGDALAAAPYQLGDEIADFTVSTYAGEEITLSEMLEEKDAVLINLWATWCGPCRSEFPAMQEAYGKYQEDVGILALSVEENDTNEVLAQFAADMGLTFPIGRDTANLGYLFQASSIPTSVMVDRFGRICYIEAGAMTDPAMFERLFDAFVGDAYTESVILRGLPGKRPDAVPAAAEELQKALNPDGSVTFRHDSYAYSWPMTYAEIDGRQAVKTSNAGVDGSCAVLHADFAAQAGDALAITFRTSTQAALDALGIAVNGERVKAFTGEHDWTTWAWEVPAAGEYTLTLDYQKLSGVPAGEDTVWLDEIALLHGDEAQAALAAVSTPDAAELTITPTDPGARRITIDDPTGMMPANYGDAAYYIIPGEHAEFRITLPADFDPETAFAFTNYDGSITPLNTAFTGGAYLVTSGIDSPETTGYPFTALGVYPDPLSDAQAVTVFFPSEAVLERFIAEYIPGSTWAEEASGPRSYTLRVLDQSGAPVPGAMVQICDDSICQVLVTAADGTAAIELPAYAYEVHVLKAPEGYSGGEEIVLAPVSGGEVLLNVIKAE